VTGINSKMDSEILLTCHTVQLSTLAGHAFEFGEILLENPVYNLESLTLEAIIFSTYNRLQIYPLT